MDETEKMNKLVTIKGFQGVILSFLKYLCQAEGIRIAERFQVMNREYETAQADYYSECSKCAEMETRLEELKALGVEKKQSFAEDFEQILAMDGIRMVLMSGNKVLLYTMPLYQTVEGQDYDIGQYEITVDFEKKYSQIREMLEFRNTPYRGLYDHRWINPGQMVCFGNQENQGGLNASIEKHLVYFNLVPLVHLILGFLKHEISEPGKHELLKECLGQPNLTGYSSEEERAAAKTAFIEFCLRINEKISTVSMLKDLTDLRSKREDIHKKISSLGSELVSLSARRNALQRMDDEGLAAKAMEEARLLVEIPQVLAISAERKTLMIDFQWDGMELTLELEHHNIPRLHAKEEDVKRLSTMITEKGRLRMDTKVLHALANAQANYRLHEVYAIVVNFLDSRKGHIGGLFEGGDSRGD